MEIKILVFFRKCVEKIQDSIQSHKNNGYFTWRLFTLVEKIKTHILRSTTFFRKLCFLWDKVEKCGLGRGDTSDVTTWRIRVACWIGKAICTYAHAHAHTPWYPHLCTQTRNRLHTRKKYVILFAFQWQQWLEKTPQCYVIRTLTICFISPSSFASFRTPFIYTCFLFYFHTFDSPIFMLSCAFKFYQQKNASCLSFAALLFSFPFFWCATPPHWVLTARRFDTKF
jgi:hypothetical protein